MPFQKCQILNLLFLVVLFVFTIVTVYQFLIDARLHSISSSKPTENSILKSCYILTLNASLEPQSLSRGLTCYPFLAERFNMEQFAMVDPLAKQKLLYPEKQTMASDLTNNNTVSISVNHARMWEKVSKLSNPALILEDDAVVPSQNVHILHDLVSKLKDRHNYVAKIGQTPHILFTFTSWPINTITQLALMEWNFLFDIHRHKTYHCVCRPWFQMSNTAAYILTPTAAKNLLQRHKPMSEHVDVYIHKQGCISRNVDFFLTHPPITFLSDRASTHKHEKSWLIRHRLLLQELIYNLKNDMCTNA